MSESAKLTLVNETMRHLGDATDIWRHEGLKRGVENFLHFAGSHAAASAVLEHLDGGVIDDPRLATELGSLQLDGPIGVAAGWDKSCRTALGWQALGARHITPGGITYWPQAGLQMPRLRTFDVSVGDHGTRRSLNAFGFYSPGVEVAKANLRELIESGLLGIPIIGQVTVNKEFYLDENRRDIPHMLAATIKELLPYVKGISLGLSSPNTAGMRDAQVKEFVRANMAAAREATITSTGRVDLSYKGDGDGGEERLDMLAEFAVETEIDVLELINTTGLSHIKARYGAGDLPGGLAGGDPDYMDMSVASVRYVYEAVGDKVDIHGMGGVGFGSNEDDVTVESSAWQALRLLRAGASAVSMNTGIRHLGYRAMRHVEKGVLAYLDEYPSVTKLGQIVGINSSRGPKLPIAV